MALLSSGDVGPTRECFLPSKLGTGLIFVVLSRPASPAAGQRWADDPSEFHHEGVRAYPDPPLHPLGGKGDKSIPKRNGFGQGR